MTSEALGPCTLEGTGVLLRPLERKDADALLVAGNGVDWSWMPMALETPGAVQDYVEWALSHQAEGRGFPFVVVERNTGRVVGSTMYLDLYSAPRRVEIGWTWYTPAAQGTRVNPECKFLLLRHAFEDWGAVRVQLKTDVQNIHSQNAIMKLGAKFEGRLRNHRFNRGGKLADSMMYSITGEEWPSVGGNLRQRLALTQQTQRAAGET